MCEIINFDGFRVKSIICNNKRMYYPNDLWKHLSGISVDRFERYLRLPETEELLRNLSGNPHIYTQHEDNTTLHIDGVITCLITQMYKDDWTEEFIACKELAEAYLEWISPSIELNPPLYDIDDDYDITDDNDLGCGY